MFRTYLRIALRNLKRHKKITVINLTAFILGLVPVILILLYVQNELSFDRYHENADRIYRVAKEFPLAIFGKPTRPSLHPGALAPTMVEVLPDVVSATRLWRAGNSGIERGENIFREENVIYADPEIFAIFSFELLRGDPKTVLAEPQSVVISEEMVEKYFGDEDPMNKVLTISGRRVQVTGVLKRVPKRSHFLMDFLLPVSLIDHGELHGVKIGPNSWRFPRWFVYFLVREGTDVDELEKAFPQFLKTNSPLKVNEIRYFFQPLTDIHFYSDLNPELGPKGDIKTVYLYLTIALILLLISCISYINLATVRSAERAREVGEKAEQIVVIDTDNSMRKNLDVIKTELNRHPNIISITATSARPNRVIGPTKIRVPGQPENVGIDICRINIDYNYLNFFGIVLLEGRNFSRDKDIRDAYILNETAVKALGWKFPTVGRELGGRWHRKGHVIGVVKDFQIESLHNEIKPLFMYMNPEDPYWCLCVKIYTDNIPTTIAEIKKVITNISPNASFNYRFYDEIFDEGYRVEQKLEWLFSVFSGLAVLIACLGLAGLAALTTEQRTKEIGIRKVFGASTVRISALLTQDFAKWVLFASVIAWPMAWYGANRWLQTFAYHVAINWGIFLLASALMLSIVLLAVSYRAFRAANANPVEALRYE